MTDTKIRSRASNRDRSSLVCTVQYSSHTWILAVIRKAWNADTVKDKKQPSSFKYAIMWSVQILHQLHSSSYLFTSWWWFWRFAPCNTNGNVKKKEKKKKVASPILPLLPPPFFLHSPSPSFCSCTPPPLSRLFFCWHQPGINGLFVRRSVFTPANLIKGRPQWCVHARALMGVSAEEQRIIRSTTVLVQTI